MNNFDVNKMNTIIYATFLKFPLHYFSLCDFIQLFHFGVYFVVKNIIVCFERNVNYNKYLFVHFLYLNYFILF